MIFLEKCRQVLNIRHCPCLEAMEACTHKFRFVSVQWKNKLASAICVYCALNIHGCVSAFTHLHSAGSLLLPLLLLVFSFFSHLVSSVFQFGATLSFFLFNEFVCFCILQELCLNESEFKAILSERNKFDSMGWYLSYPFSIGDWTICIVVLFDYLESNSNIPWADQIYLR